MQIRNYWRLFVLFSLVAYASAGYSQSFNLNDPTIIYKDEQGRVFSKDSLIAFVSRGGFSMQKNETADGKVEVILSRPSISEREREANESQQINRWKGSAFPVFNLITIDGVSLTQRDLLGKITVLNFWFTGCQPCIREMPELNKLTAKYPQLNFVGFTFNDSDRVKKFLSQHTFNYRQVANAGQLCKALGIEAYPTHMIIDEKGIIHDVVLGASDDIYHQLESIIIKALN